MTTRKKRLPLALCAGVAALAIVGASATTASADGELRLYNWSNYFPPSLLERFEKETGTKVSIDNYASEEDLLAKLQAGGAGYDVIFPGTTTLGVMVKQDLLEKIDVNQMENFANVLDAHQTIAGDEERVFSAPYMWGTTGFTYDPAMVPGGELAESWKAVFEPADELKGNIAMLNEMSDVWNAGAYYLGISKCTEDAAEAQQILDLLMAQKPHVKLYSNDGTIDRMVAGEVAVHMQWNGAAHRVKAKKPDVVYVYPKEGTTFWTDAMAVPKGAPNLENAKAFINWMMKPEIAAEASNYTGYSNAIKGSGEFLKEDLRGDPAVNTPEEYGERLRPYEACSEKSRDLRERVWTKLKS
ncbi:extracellular solute-binding protein [Nitratireductor mangrovi]|uniref:Putrescine-binding periplasmic protein n=1 Tax=Nitratireductor mangrovi TaxID=2599600 RepID=A0A5B8L1S1_9HYPH|nr:extracellular solute-binding protein [Nitratireductor mangrovi]QDZ01763.1 extracellular solute-binding protein [Nitratireductor mangrovi]